MRGGVTDIICALRPKNSGENTAAKYVPCVLFLVTVPGLPGSYSSCPFLCALGRRHMSPILCLGLQALLIQRKYIYMSHAASAVTRITVDGSIDNFPHARCEAHDVDVYT